MAKRANQKDRLIDRIEQAEDRYLQLTAGNQNSPLQSVDLTMQQLKTLLFLAVHDGASGQELADALGVGLAAVTGIAKRLADRGFVRRAEDPLDRRIRRVYLTEDGVDLLARIREAGRENKRRLLRRLDGARLAQLAEVMEALNDAAETDAAETDAAENRRR
jgi:DNA-binding MarR family transcriptional regulator